MTGSTSGPASPPYRFDVKRIVSKADVVQVRKGAVFFFGFMLQRAATALLVPALVLRLTPADLSRFGLLQSFILIAPALLSLRVHTALGRLIYDVERSNRSELLWSGLVGALVPVAAAGIAVVGLTAMGTLVDPLALGDPILAVAILIILLARIVVEFASILFRADGNERRFFIVAISDGGAYLAFAVWLFLPDSVSYRTCLLALALASVAGLGGVMFSLRGVVGRPQISKSAYRASLKYSWPTAGHMLGLWLSSQAARWIGSANLGLEAIAGFSTAMLGLSVVTVVSRVIFEVRRPTVGRAFASGNTESGRRVLNSAQRQAVGLSALLGFIGVVIFSLFSGRLGSNYDLPILGLAALLGFVILDSAALRYTNLLLAMKKSFILMVASVSAGAIAVLAGAVLVQLLGLTGLCLAVMAGALLQLCFVGAASRRQPSTSDETPLGVT